MVHAWPWFAFSGMLSCNIYAPRTIILKAQAMFWLGDSRENELQHFHRRQRHVHISRRYLQNACFSSFNMLFPSLEALTMINIAGLSEILQSFLPRSWAIEFFLWKTRYEAGLWCWKLKQKSVQWALFSLLSLSIYTYVLDRAASWHKVADCLQAITPLTRVYHWEYINAFGAVQYV